MVSNKDKFIEKAIKKHGLRYDYSNLKGYGFIENKDELLSLI